MNTLMTSEGGNVYAWMQQTLKLGEPDAVEQALAALPPDGHSLTLLPFLAAKQRPTDDNDWMTTDTDVACPDPHCGAVFRITRTGQRTFSHADVTRVPLPPADG